MLGHLVIEDSLSMVIFMNAHWLLQK